MSSEQVLGRIRAALDHDAPRSARTASTVDRLARPPEHPLPARARRPAEELVHQFVAIQSGLGVDLIEVGSPADIPPAIEGYLLGLGLACRLRHGSDPLLVALPWSASPHLVVDIGAARDGDPVGLSRAVAGVAETGTLALASGADNPVTLGFVPDTHIVVLRADTIVGSYEAACALVRAAFDGAMPRTLNLVTGASRTGDIGGKIVMGAHGPRRLAVILIRGVV
ncbi:MAG: LUD domain-containing protein [Hyphomicrobium sp.]